MRTVWLFLAAATILPTPAIADEAPPACTAPVTPGGELAPWAQPKPLKAAANAKGLKAAALSVGQAAEVTLLPTPEVAYPLRPEKPGGSVSHGGLIGLTIVEAGTYRVALSSGAWIDVVGGGKAMVSVKHGHGPACSGVRKMVDFTLTPGRYTLQIAASGTPGITVLVARLP